MKQRILIFTLLCLVCACAAEIGDDCNYDDDCTVEVDDNRYCDSSQPGGYCLIIGCTPDECPSEASCVEFTTPCPTGEGYGEDSVKCQLLESNRGRTYCLKHCKKNSDCRSGYKCEKASNLSAEIIDLEHPREKVCVPK